ncbi:type 1 glutamine amidotransferase [Haloarchaeobius sp. TZWSO28]|uniref:type 1 glutamine amidotransferase n=1 Tax=Haloarchaeobius sp. TZWSO28 TaxID=3446119 RepID=UPI003EBC2ADF
MQLACLAPPSRFDYPSAIERVLGAQLPDQPEMERFAPHRGVLPAQTDYDLVILAGSQAHVTEPEPWFGPLADYVERALGAGTPLLGVCFGHQFLADLLGGIVEPLTGQRTGVSTIERTAASDAHPRFAGLPRSFESFVYHSDHVASVPPNATVLARDDSGIQAFAATDRPVLGIQFHPEFTAAMAARTDAGTAVPALADRLAASRTLYATALADGLTTGDSTDRGSESGVTDETADSRGQSERASCKPGGVRAGGR